MFAHQGLGVTDITFDNANPTNDRHAKQNDVQQIDTPVFVQISHRSCLVECHYYKIVQESK